MSSTDQRPRPTARSLGDEQLVEAMARPGCPMCHHVAAVSPRFLDSLLYQHTTDRTYRDRFLKGGGFCARHVRDAVAADAAGNGDGVGAAIFLRSMLAARRRELEGARGFRAGKRIRAASRPAWDCPVCENETSTAAAASQRMVEHARGDEVWHAWVVAASWCLTHLGDILAAADELGGGAPDGLLDRQLGLMRGLDDRLEALAHDSSHGRRELLTPEVRSSLSEAAEMLAGVDGETRSR